MFAFTSMGGKIDTEINRGRRSYVYRLCGQNVHRIGSLLPDIGKHPTFAQLYIYDTENEISNRVNVVRYSKLYILNNFLNVNIKLIIMKLLSNFFCLFFLFSSVQDDNSFDKEIVCDLRKMLDRCNLPVKTFRMTREIFHTNEGKGLKIRIM